MAMDAEEFRESVLIYGADVHRWPDEIRHAGVEALARSIECRSLQQDYAQFEAALGSRAYEGPRPDLAHRIVAAARQRERSALPGMMEFLRSCFRDLRLPAPVLTVAAVLVVGVVVGLLLPAESSLVDSELVEAQTFLDSTTEAL
jgi:hypothetical protein